MKFNMHMQSRVNNLTTLILSVVSITQLILNTTARTSYTNRYPFLCEQVGTFTNSR